MKFIFAFLFGFMLFSPSFLSADLIEKGSNSDKAIGVLLEKSGTAFSAIVDEVLSDLKSAKDMAKEELPKICKEFLHWQFYICVIWLCVGLTIMSLSIWFFHLLKNSDWKENDGSDVAARWGVAIVGCLISSLFIVNNLLDMAYIYFAPRVYILKHLVDLIKTGGQGL